MKKNFISVVFAIGLIFCLVSCGENKTEVPKRDPESPITYIDFNSKDKNGNYFDNITGNALYTKGNVTECDGYEGMAAHFDGDSSLELSNFEGIEGNQAFTLSLKVRADVDDYSVTLDYTAIGIGNQKEFGNAKIGSHYGKYCMYYVNKYAYVNFPGDNKTNWHSLSLSYDGEKFCFYLDGSIGQTVRVKDGMSLEKTSLYIGGYKGNGENFIGDIDEVYVFDRCLESTELKSYLKMEKEVAKISPNNIEPTSNDGNIFSDLAKTFVNDEWTEGSVVANKVTLKFIIHMPENYNPAKKYPLLLFLHGAGSNSWEPRRILGGGEATAVDRTLDYYPDTIILVPANIENWVNINTPKVNGLTPEWSYEKTVPSKRLIAVIELINGLIEPLNIDRERIHFQGVSAGCIGGWYLFARYPGMFASAIMVEGTGPKEEEAIKNIAKTPTWMFMSKDDQLVSYVDFEKLYNNLVKAGADTRLTSVTGYDHFGTNQVVYAEKDLVHWLYSYPKK